MPDDVPVATNYLTVEDGDASVDQLLREAEVVVHGRIASVESLGRPAAAEDSLADEYIGLVVEVEKVLAGSIDGAVRLSWDAFQTNEKGERVATLLSNGLRPPQQGDEVLLFLLTPDPAYIEYFGGFPTHAPVRLDGVAYMEDGVVREVEYNSSAGRELLGRSVAEVESVMALRP